MEQPRIGQVRLAYFVSHPIQYQVPLLRRLSATPDIALKVFFASDFSVHGYRDVGFEREIRWDTPLTEGLDFKFLSQAPATEVNRVWGGDIEGMLRAGSFDAVWVHGWAYLWSLRVITAARRLNIPVIFRCEFNSQHYPPPGSAGKVKMCYLCWLFRKIDAFLTIGTLNREFYLRAGVQTRRLFHVPYAVDNEKFSLSNESGKKLKFELLRAAGVKSTTPILLFTGKFSDVKRPRDLVEVWRSLLQSGQQTFLLFVGDGPLRVDIEKECLSIAQNLVHFAGFQNQSELPSYYSASDVFVLPSGIEPWGLVVNEAMAAGLPIVTTEAAGCAPDLVKTNCNGQVVPIGNIEAMTKGVLWCLAHRQAAGEASRKIIDYWSYRECELGIRSALKSIASSRKISRV